MFLLCIIRYWDQCSYVLFRLFGIKCAKCNIGFCSSDLVMRARDNVYHMECFRCSVCSRHLVPGDEFSLRDEELLCRADHGLLLERASAGSPISPGNILSRSFHIAGQWTNNGGNNNESIILIIRLITTKGYSIIIIIIVKYIFFYNNSYYYTCLQNVPFTDQVCRLLSL